MDYKIKYKGLMEYLELKNIIASKKILMKNKNGKLHNYLGEFYKLIICFVSFYIISRIDINPVFNIIFYILLILSLGLILSYLFLFLFFVIQYNDYFKGRKGRMEFFENGIVDFSDKGYNCGFSWDKVDLIVVGKKSTVIFSKFPFCLFINSKDNKELLNNVSKYAEDVKIVYRKK